MFFKKKQHPFNKSEIALIETHLKKAELTSSCELRIFIERDCVFDDAIDRAKEIFNEFMDHWYSTIEIEFMKFWLYLKEDGTSNLYKYSIEDLNKIKDHAKTIWRDLYILIYHKDNSNGLNNVVHADFSNYTFSCGLTNASEFEGGELVFPRQNFSMKIDKGQMLIFPGGLTHPHYTKDVIDGTRFQFIGQSAPQKQDKTLY